MLKVVIHDTDSHYLNRLINQLSNIKQSHYEFSAYSDLVHLKKSMEADAAVDVLISSDNDLVMDKRWITEKRAIHLSEHKNLGDKTSLFKYQDVQRFLNELDVLLGYIEVEVGNQDKAKVTLVVSAEGKSGKSTVSVAAAKISAFAYKTIMLTFETHSALDQLLNTQYQMSMTDLFYTIKKKSQLQQEDYHQLFYKDDHLGFYVMKPFESFADLQVIETDDLNKLFGILMDDCGFKRIIIEAGGLTGLSHTLVQHSHEIWVVKGNDKYSDIRGLRLTNELRRLVTSNYPTIKVIANTLSTSKPASHDNADDCQLPYESLLDFSFQSPKLSVMSMDYYCVLNRFMTGA